MPKVLMVSTVGVTIESFLVPMARGLQDAGWEVHAACRGAVDSGVLQEVFDGVHELYWDRSPAGVRGIAASISILRKLQDEGGFDVVHLHTPVAAFYGRLALQRSRTSGNPRVLYTAHGFHFYEGQGFLPHAAYYTAERMAGRWTDYLITMNREDHSAASRFGTIPEDRVRMILGVGIDTRYYSRESMSVEACDAVRERHGIPASAPVILMIAELNKNKRPDSVVRAFLPVGRSTGAHLLIAGPGPHGERCRKLAAEAGLGQQVHFLGRVADVRPYIGTSLVAVLYSIREGLPRSIMECLSMEVPVIASDIRGNADLLTGGSGWLVPPMDETALTRTMLSAIEDPAECRKRGVAGRSLMCGQYEVGTVVEQYVRLYREALTA